MVERDADTRARNARIRELSEDLRLLLPRVLAKTGFANVHSLHGKLGGKNREFLDFEDAVITSHTDFINQWITGYARVLETKGARSAYSATHALLCRHSVFRKYLKKFLERMYLRNHLAWSRKRPCQEDAAIWMGPNEASYGLLITPVFDRKRRTWLNDHSEVRHFPKRYWTIGHVLQTGLVVPGKRSIFTFRTVKEYLRFFRDVLVRAAKSPHQKVIASLYCKHVQASDDPESVPLLIPELRYGGLDHDHKYRLDFCIIDEHLNKVGFELSPWSTHGRLRKTTTMTTKAVNDLAQANFEKEMTKHKAYFRRRRIFVLIYTDVDLTRPMRIFREMKRYLETRHLDHRVSIAALNDFFRGPRGPAVPTRAVPARSRRSSM